MAYDKTNPLQQLMENLDMFYNPSKIKKRLNNGDLIALDDLLGVDSSKIPTNFITKFKTFVSSKYPDILSKSWNAILIRVYYFPGIHYLNLIETPDVSGQDVINMENQDTNHELLSITLFGKERFYNAGILGRLWVRFNILEQQRNETNNKDTPDELKQVADHKTTMYNSIDELYKHLPLSNEDNNGIWTIRNFTKRTDNQTSKIKEVIDRNDTKINLNGETR